MQDSKLDGDTVAYNAAISDWGKHDKPWDSEKKQTFFSMQVGVLGGGFTYFLFSPRKLEKISILTNIFQLGWNHQLGVRFKKIHVLMCPVVNRWVGSTTLPTPRVTRKKPMEKYEGCKFFSPPPIFYGWKKP